MPNETEESGPIQTGIWDTRTRENSYWCEGCRNWLRKSSHVTEEQHKEHHCPGRKGATHG